MNTVYILVGLMGVGKTTLASKMGCQTIDFDAEYHTRLSNNRESFMDYVIEKINGTECDVVIDGWFKWDKEWYETHHDKTIESLEDRLINHSVVILFMMDKHNRILGRYERKHTAQSKNAEYIYTMTDREANLFEKCREWVYGKN